jgi:DNA-binding transcriptional regulator GbsR (MarR family)
MEEAESIRSAIVIHEGNLETRQRYERFLMLFCPEELELLEYFSAPEVLVQDLHRIENENLFLLERCEHLQNILGGVLKPIQDGLETEAVQEARAKQDLTQILKVERALQPVRGLSQRQVDEIESEYARVVRLVEHASATCFGGETELSPMAVLEQFQSEFERLFRLEAMVQRAVLEDKQAAKQKERREAQRKSKQAQFDLEQQKKLQQARERAAKPIPQKFKRPVVPRMVPVTEKLSRSELDSLKKREERRLERLLYTDEDGYFQFDNN